MKTYRVSLPGLGSHDYPAATAGKARYDAWLSLDGSYYRKFADFLKVVRVSIVKGN